MHSLYRQIRILPPRPSSYLLHGSCKKGVLHTFYKG
jgi:hypothetical protein